MAVYLKSVVIILLMTMVDVSESMFCQPEEKFSLCGNNDCRPSCTYPKGPKHCNPKCRPGCICKKPLVRREPDNHCVPVSECPKPTGRPTRRPQPPTRRPQSPRIRPHLLSGPPGVEKCAFGEVYDWCHKDVYCLPSCQYPKGGPGIAKDGMCRLACFRGCVCKQGLLRREKDNKCVPPNQCQCERKRPKMMSITRKNAKKNEKKKCPPGEEYDKCHKDVYCLPSCRYPKGGPGIAKDGMCRLACYRGCVCKKGLLRREKDNKCVPPSQCPDEDQCDKGEVYEECHPDPNCLPTCEHPSGKNEQCNAKCHHGCVCQKHLVRRESDKKCVPRNECPDRKCPPKLRSRWPGRKCQS